MQKSQKAQISWMRQQM